MKDPTPEELEGYFKLEDGKLLRLWRGVFWKEVASVPNHKTGYCNISFLGRQGRHVKFHRMIWILANGPIPEGLHLDHINGNKTDNRLENLRLVSCRENNQNKAKHRAGKLLGCSWHKHTKKWVAQVRLGPKNVYLGSFDTPEAAHGAYCNFVKGLEKEALCL